MSFREQGAITSDQELGQLLANVEARLRALERGDNLAGALQFGDGANVAFGLLAGGSFGGPVPAAATVGSISLPAPTARRHVVGHLSFQVTGAATIQAEWQVGGVPVRQTTHEFAGPVDTGHSMLFRDLTAAGVWRVRLNTLAGTPSVAAQWVYLDAGSATS